MKKILLALVLTAVCCSCLVSCHEVPKHYKFVKVISEGNEEVEEIIASSDTAALKLYLDRLEKMLVENFEKGLPQQYEAMYIISPDGDTLNTDEELLKSVVPLAPQTTMPAKQ